MKGNIELLESFYFIDQLVQNLESFEIRERKIFQKITKSLFELSKNFKLIEKAFAELIKIASKKIKKLDK